MPEDNAEQPTEEVYLGELELNSGPIEIGKGRRVENTRATLAYCLFGLLSAVLVALLLLLAFKRLTPEQFAEVGGVALSPIIALLGAATGYYYGRGDR